MDLSDRKNPRGSKYSSILDEYGDEGANPQSQGGTQGATHSAKALQGSGENQGPVAAFTGALSLVEGDKAQMYTIGQKRVFVQDGKCLSFPAATAALWRLLL